MKYIDLTHTLTENIPVWPGAHKLELETLSDYDQGYRLVSVKRSALGIGTHIDAPTHFVDNKIDIDKIPLEQLIGPLCVIDCREKVAANPDYGVSREDVSAWEKQYGKIPKGSIVVSHTGWSQYWHEPSKYINQDDSSHKHFPGFLAEAASVLLERGISGIGIDALSVDVGISEDFPVHQMVLGANKFQIENMANLDNVPRAGALLIALPIKLTAPEAPARIIALVM